MRQAFGFNEVVQGACFAIGHNGGKNRQRGCHMFFSLQALGPASSPGLHGNPIKAWQSNSRFHLDVFSKNAPLRVFQERSPSHCDCAGTAPSPGVSLSLSLLSCAGTAPSLVCNIHESFRQQKFLPCRAVKTPSALGEERPRKPSPIVRV